MAISVYVGKPGHGKTIALMRQFVEVCKTNEKIFNKTGFRRTIKTCIHPSPKLYARYAFYIEVFRDLDWLPYASNCDIFIDEMGTFLIQDSVLTSVLKLFIVFVSIVTEVLIFMVLRKNFLK